MTTTVNSKSFTALNYGRLNIVLQAYHSESWALQLGVVFCYVGCSCSIKIIIIIIMPQADWLKKKQLLN